MDTVLAALQEILTPEGGWRAQLVVRVMLSTLLLFTFIVLLARTFGTRTFSSFTTYDFLTNVAAGSLVASAILGRSIIEASLALFVLVVLQFLVSGASARWSPVQDAADNDPVVLVEHGQRRDRAMRSSRVSPAILDQHLRQAGVRTVDDVHLAVLESGGTISVITR